MGLWRRNIARATTLGKAERQKGRNHRGQDGSNGNTGRITGSWVVQDEEPDTSVRQWWRQVPPWSCWLHCFWDKSYAIGLLPQACSTSRDWFDQNVGLDTWSSWISYNWLQVINPTYPYPFVESSTEGSAIYLQVDWRFPPTCCHLQIYWGYTQFPWTKCKNINSKSRNLWATNLGQLGQDVWEKFLCVLIRLFDSSLDFHCWLLNLPGWFLVFCGLDKLSKMLALHSNSLHELHLSSCTWKILTESFKHTLKLWHLAKMLCNEHGFG